MPLLQYFQDCRNEAALYNCIPIMLLLNSGGCESETDSIVELWNSGGCRSETDFDPVYFNISGENFVFKDGKIKDSFGSCNCLLSDFLPLRELPYLALEILIYPTLTLT